MIMTFKIWHYCSLSALIRFISNRQLHILAMLMKFCMLLFFKYIDFYKENCLKVIFVKIVHLGVL